jgi:hypothetical protein
MMFRIGRQWTTVRRAPSRSARARLTLTPARTVALVLAAAACSPAPGPARGPDTAPAKSALVSVHSAAFGPLPPGSVSLSAQSGVHAEVSFRHLIPPDRVAGKIPHGLHPLTLREVAVDNSAAAAFLARRADFATYAIGSLTFLAVDTTMIDGAPLTGHPPDMMAFWWVLAAPSDSVRPPDPRARGDHSVELGFWLGNSAAAARIRATGWPASTPPSTSASRRSSRSPGRVSWS